MGAYERGQAAWPTVKLDRATFASHLQTLEAPEQHAEDLFLACACAQGDAEALRLFDEQVLAQVPLYLSRIDPSPVVADEVKQHLRAQLLVGDGGGPGIARYSGRGALGGWVRVIAVRQLHRMRDRKIDRAPVDDGELVHRLADTDPGPELQLIRARYRDELQAALQTALARLSERDRLLLKMALIDEMSVDELGAFFHVHRATAARWVVALKQQLTAVAMEHVKARLQLDTAEAESLCALVRSQIDLSLTGFAG
jgi:RNA polymerase sigma-70 factor (ECF subfamily)